MTKEQDEITWGKRMIKVSIQFWTNNLPKKTDKKTAWANGALHMMANKQRGIKHNHVFFNSMEEFMPKLKELLDKNGVRLIKAAKFETIHLDKLGE